MDCSFLRLAVCKECLQTHFGKQRVEAYQRKARGRRSGQGASQAQAQLQAQAQAQAQAQSQVAANGAARERDAAGDGDNESSSDESSSARRPNLCPQCGEDLGGDPWKTSIRCALPLYLYVARSLALTRLIAPRKARSSAAERCGPVAARTTSRRDGVVASD
jgi:hypothetical protein